MFNGFKRALGVLAAAATVPLIGLSAISPATAAVTHVTPNATPACAFNCFRLSSLALGRNQIQNAYIPGNLGTGAKAGQKINLHFAENTQVNADFTGAQVGTLANFCESGANPTGPLSAQSYACINYPPNFPVFESDWSPFGNQSGFCAAVALPATVGESVTLQSCGHSAGSLWVGDLNDSVVRHGHIYFPWVNGGDSNFSHPLTLQVDPGTTGPADQLKLATLNSLTGGTEPDTQAWTFDIGPVA